MSTPAISIQNLTKVYPIPFKREKVTAVQDLSLTVEPGQVYGLLGPNGSGKSTTMKIVLGLVSPNSGKTEIFGRDSNTVESRENVGFLPENPYFYKYLTGEETLHFYGRLCGLSQAKLRDRSKELLKLVRLENAADRRLGGYSKGMLQRIGLAQAMIQEPRLLVLDEPTAGVDPAGSREIRDLILDFKQRGITVLLCSHLLEQVQEICDRVGILNHGQLIREGVLTDLISIENQTELILENASPELLAQVRELIGKSSAHLAGEHKPQRTLERYFLDINRFEGLMTATLAPPATPHKVFSPARVSAIASNTLLELVRLKVFYFMLLFAILGIGISLPLASMKIHEQFQILKDASLGAMSVFTWLLAVLATAMLLPKDIEDRTLYTILAKPVPRFEYLLGKFIGILLMLFVAISAMTVFFLGILYLREHTALADALRTTPPNLLQTELDTIRNNAFNQDLIPGIVLIYLKAALSAALTLFLSTFASSSIFTIMVSCVVYLIGHVQHIARDALQDAPNASPLLLDFLGTVAVLVPDMNAISFVDEVVVSSGVPALLFIKAATLAIVYITAYFLLGFLVFWGEGTMKTLQKYPRTAAILLLVLFGFAKWPFEARLEAERKAAHVNFSNFNLSLREQLGQMSFLAAVGGFRALVGDYCYLQAHNEWSRVEWGRMKLNFDACTALMPHCILFWDQAYWQMAYNASVAAYNDKKQPREALRYKAQHDYWKVGEDYLIRGIANNPDSSTLYDHLGFLYRDKFKDHCKSAEIYAECAKIPNAPVYAHRFALYELAKCEGHEREAYEGLLKLYKKGEDERLPTLLKTLGQLQEKLNIPADQKVYIPPDSHP